MRLIDADALIRVLKGRFERFKDLVPNIDNSIEFAHSYALNSVTNAPTISEGWIPIKYHGITESERKENGYPKDWVYFLDCEMPQDGQEILVQAKNGEIRWDVCYEDDGFSLDSGWDWKDDITAWMPLPEPYKEDDNEN